MEDEALKTALDIPLLTMVSGWIFGVINLGITIFTVWQSHQKEKVNLCVEGVICDSSNHGVKVINKSQFPIHIKEVGYIDDKGEHKFGQEELKIFWGDGEEAGFNFPLTLDALKSETFYFEIHDYYNFKWENYYVKTDHGEKKKSGRKAICLIKEWMKIEDEKCEKKMREEDAQAMKEFEEGAQNEDY